jgi:hypothetical protein
MYFHKHSFAAVCVACTLLGSGSRLHAQARVTLAPPSPPPVAAAPAIALAAPSAASARIGMIASQISLADVGFGAGFRFANLGGRREIFVPVPRGADINPTDLVLTLDDMSAHDARRNLEVQINDRSVAAIALDGKSIGRVVRIPLTSVRPRDGFLKLSFLYSGAATQDRCIDVRYVGDSLTIRPESAVQIDVVSKGMLDVATTVALLPRDVVVALPSRRLTPSDFASALTVARFLTASGRRVSFRRGGNLSEFVARNEAGRWSGGLVIIGTADDVTGQTDLPLVTVAGPSAGFGSIAVVSVAGLPALLVSDATTPARASRLLASPSLAMTRGVNAASVGAVPTPKLPSDRISFDQLSVAPALGEVFGRAELAIAISNRSLPAGTFMSRLLLDITVAPDEAGEKAVVSVFVNEHLLGSTIAASGEPTRLDLALPAGLVGNAANIRAVVQRRSSQGDCRFEPQGYPAQILGSSSLILGTAATRPHDFSDLSARWADGIEVLIPDTAGENPAPFLGLLSSVLSMLSPDTAPVTVKFTAAGSPAVPTAAFIAVSNVPPKGATPLMSFDRGRIAAVDREGHTLLELGGLTTGAVAQLVMAGEQPGLWIRPLAADGMLPNPTELRLDRGDIAILDKVGTSLAMSTERDTLISIAYPDEVSWATVAARFRSWVIGGLWVFGTVLFLFMLQRMYRRRSETADE